MNEIVLTEYQKAPKLYFDCITALECLIDGGVPESVTIETLLSALREAEQQEHK